MTFKMKQNILIIFKVINTHASHIINEWVSVVMTKPPETMKVLPPSQFEPLYEPTGNEQMPQPRDQGQVVYYNDPGDEEFFTRNRIQSLYYESS